MGYLILMAECVRCHEMMACNPDLVPSVVINGNREPICRSCVEWANPRRQAQGLEPINILPGAYDPQETE